MKKFIQDLALATVFNALVTFNNVDSFHPQALQLTHVQYKIRSTKLSTSNWPGRPSRKLAANVNAKTTTNSQKTIFDDVDGLASGEPKPLEDVQNILSYDPYAQDVSNQIVSSLNDFDLPQIHTEKNKEPESEAPSVSKILKFAIPAIGVWLCGPILSLIDTAAVGLLSGTKQQAGLNPAVAICEYVALLFAFLFTATTNNIASANESERFDPEKPKTKTTLIASMQLSAYFGTVVAVLQLMLSPYLIRGIIGNKSADPVIYGAAFKYVNIRAIGQPAAAIIGTAQAACLGMQDIRSPLYVLVAAAFVNLIGDILFVGRQAAWVGGTAGAAWATVFSQYAALILFLKWMTTSGTASDTQSDDNMKIGASNKVLALFETQPPLFKVDSEKMSVGSSPKNPLYLRKSRSAGMREKMTLRRSNNLNLFDGVGKSCYARGFLARRFDLVSLFKFPDFNIVKKFFAFFLPVTMTSFGRVSAYVSLSHVVATSLGTISMAAQQIIISIFYALTPIADSLSLTAQSFVPGVFESVDKDKSAKMLQTTKNFMKAGIYFGMALASLSGVLIPLLGSRMTTDISVVHQVYSCVPYLVAFLGLHGLVLSTEGLLLAQKELSYLGTFYAFFFFIFPSIFFYFKRMALLGKNVTLATLWKVMMGFNLTRCTIWAIRCIFLSWNRRNQNDKDKSTDALLI